MKIKKAIIKGTGVNKPHKELLLMSALYELVRSENLSIYNTTHIMINKVKITQENTYDEFIGGDEYYTYEVEFTYCIEGRDSL